MRPHALHGDVERHREAEVLAGDGGVADGAAVELLDAGHELPALLLDGGQPPWTFGICEPVGSMLSASAANSSVCAASYCPWRQSSTRRSAIWRVLMAGSCKVVAGRAPRVAAQNLHRVSARATAQHHPPRSLPAPGPDHVQRVVQPRLRAQREALGDAVDQLPGAGGGVQPALVADVPAP